MRRIALGLTAALVTARAYWPSEPDVRSGAGAGLFWVLAILIAAGLALAASFIGGRFRWRWSWTDLALALLVVLVAVSANHAVDRRPAINLAWEWVALGVAYVLVRNLPRTPQESSVLAGILVATAVAVSVYGLYQAKVELPMLREQFQRNPQQVLQQLNIDARPGSPEELLFRDRLLYSNEVFSTFALANSLAGFIVGPLVIALAVGFQNLVRRDAPGSRWALMGMAAPLVLAMLVCLILTKSRSAWVGLFAALGILAWDARRRVPARVLLGTGLAGVVVVIGLVVGAWAAGRLDREVLTQSPMSLRYRWEYWQGAWGVVTDGASGLKGVWNAPTFWWGGGPGNFAGPYLRHKLPQASEAIQDPHNLFLEVWATAGFWALLALLAALGFGLVNLFVPSTAAANQTGVDRAASIPRKVRRSQATTGNPIAEYGDGGDDSPPRSVRWLIASAGAGWILVLLVGEFNLFQADLFPRWLILGATWMAAVFLGGPLWARLPLPVSALGAAVVAVVINLLAAGGIGIPTVALGLWIMLALGLNLRGDRACSRLREFPSRMPALGLAVAWAAVVGTFFGLVMPFWRSEAAMAQAEEALHRLPPDYERAARAYEMASAADRYNSRAWIGEAYRYLEEWKAHGAKATDDRLKRVSFLLEMAVTPPRNPYAWSVHTACADAMAQVLNAVGPQLSPIEALRYQGKIVAATRRASRLNPTNAQLHARLAEASAAISMYRDAATEAEEALRLDRITPHLDKKLLDPVRTRLQARLPDWQERSAQNANLDAIP
jgi:O-antigen ligase